MGLGCVISFTEIVKGYADSEVTKVDKEIEIEAENTETKNEKLRKLIMDENYWGVYNKLESRNALTEKIDSDGNTILHITATVGKKNIVEKVILSNKNMLHIKNNEGKTALDKAYENMHLDIIAYLEGAAKDDEICKKGAETETKDLPQLIADGDWYAVYLKSTQLSEEINSDGNTLLHIAAEIGDYNLISAILWREPYCNWTRIKNKHGSTVLHIAAIAGNTNGAELLVKHNKRLLEIQDDEGRTPLDKASEKGNLNTVRYLKEAANEGAKRVTNKNKLQELIEDQDWVGVYQELGEDEALTEKINSNGNTLLHIAVEIGNGMLISEMLKPHACLYIRCFYLRDYDLTKIKNNDGSTVLHIAAIVGNTSAAKILIETDKRLLNIPDNKGKTPLDKANENGHLKTISYLQKAADFQKLIVDGDWFKVYTKLRKRNALTEIIDGDGNTLLHKVIEISRNDFVNKILSHLRSYDLTDMESYNGSTVLHIAAIVGNTDAAVLLVKHDRQLLDIRDNEGKTPLEKAYGNRHLKNTIAKLDQAVKITEANELRQLVVDGDWYKVIVKLYKRNALQEKINSNGNTLLHILVGMGDDFLIKATLWRISDHDLTTIKNAEGSTVLHIAAIVGNPNAAKILVKENKELLYTKDNDGKTPLDKAYENMHLDTIAYLLEAIEEHENGKEEAQEASTVHPRKKKDADVEKGVALLANAISAKRYDVALN
ncbi:uncharacterized protein LOC143566034 [Bidens hawaiensis]|uniref:uncharacterized protein LOC143566034 n=1 Tax=Bidens hawaiensis TaxID=980011 RepID=UPI00404A3315